MVKPVQAPPVAALATASNVTAATQRTMTPNQPSNNAPLSVMIVEIIGYGGGDGVQDQRQDEKKQHKSENNGIYDPKSSFKLLGNGMLTQEQQKNLTDDERSKLRQFEQSNAL